MNEKTSYIVAELVVSTLQPLTFTHHGIKDLPMMIRGVDTEGRPHRTVFLPAGQLRGRIRHEAALAKMRAMPDKVKLEEAYMLALGQDLRPEEEDEPESVRIGEQVKFRQANPFLDLFGTWKVASRLFVSHLLPEVNVMPDRMAHIRRDLDTNEDIMQELGEIEQDRFYDRQEKQSLASKAGAIIKIVEAELKSAKKAKDQAKVDQLEAKLAELLELKKSHKGSDESENTKHLVEIQAIPAGIDLHGKLTIKHPLPSDVGLLVDALNGISQSPYMGAQRARGCGEVLGKATFKTTDGEVLVKVTFGGHTPASIEWTEAGKAFMDTQPVVA